MATHAYPPHPVTETSNGPRSTGKAIGMVLGIVIGMGILGLLGITVLIAAVSAFGSNAEEAYELAQTDAGTGSPDGEFGLDTGQFEESAKVIAVPEALYLRAGAIGDVFTVTTSDGKTEIPVGANIEIEKQTGTESSGIMIVSRVNPSSAVTVTVSETAEAFGQQQDAQFQAMCDFIVEEGNADLAEAGLGWASTKTTGGEIASCTGETTGAADYGIVVSCKAEGRTVACVQVESPNRLDRLEAMERAWGDFKMPSER